MFIKKYLKETLICVNILLSIILICLISYFYFADNNKNSTNDIAFAYEESDNTYEDDIIRVEVKGSVKKPGVYELNSNSIINDLIKKAEGFTKNAYTNNINLSKKLKDQMVIYVYSKYEYSQLNKKDDIPKEEIPVCNCPTYDITSCIENGESIITSNSNNTQNEVVNNVEEKNEITLVNINTADESMLTTLSGIGSSKAKSIIEYRNKNGNFTSVEDITKVSGISNTIYEKIKDYITV